MHGRSARSHAAWSALAPAATRVPVRGIWMRCAAPRHADTTFSPSAPGPPPVLVLALVRMCDGWLGWVVLPKKGFILAPILIAAQCDTGAPDAADESRRARRVLRVPSGPIAAPSCRKLCLPAHSAHSGYPGYSGYSGYITRVLGVLRGGEGTQVLRGEEGNQGLSDPGPGWPHPMLLLLDWAHPFIECAVRSHLHLVVRPCAEARTRIHAHSPNTRHRSHAYDLTPARPRAHGSDAWRIGSHSHTRYKFQQHGSAFMV